MRTQMMTKMMAGWMSRMSNFPPEGSLDVSPNVDLSSQCLAASLSEEPSRDTSDPQPNLRRQEAHGELSELDNDFPMDLF